MTNRKEIRKLSVLANLILDHRLSELKRATDDKAHSEAALADLRLKHPRAEGLNEAAAALAELRYEQWADVRRADINHTLARQTHDWLQAQDAARVAFGKAEALRKMSEKLKP